MKNTGMNFGGSWTEQKLECVSNYLNAYTSIMRSRDYIYTYIDAFAGTGYRKQKYYDEPEIQCFLAGSARRALEAKYPFPSYIFIEANKGSYAELKKLRDEFSNLNIRCINKEANEYVSYICEEWDWHENRVLLFLDPFGMQIEWSTIELIAHTQAIDLWLLFPIGMGVNRTLYNDGKIPISHRKKLDQLFGRTDWYNEFYQLTRQIPLLGENGELEKKDNNLKNIEQYYLKRLKSIFPLVAQNPLPLYNSKKSLMYLLCFAAGNPNAPKALKIAEEILEKMQSTIQLKFPF